MSDENADTDKLSDALFRRETLHPDLRDFVQTDGPLGPMIHHPLTIQITYHPDHCAIINTQYEARKAKVEADLQSGNFKAYVFSHERPYRLDALRRVAQRMRDADYWRLVARVWIDSENIHQETAKWLEVWSADRSARSSVMSDGERRALEALPETITIFRGYAHASSRLGLSWTTNEAVARWYANRYRRKGKVIKRAIQKDNVLAYFKGRNESEIVAFPELVETD